MNTLLRSLLLTTVLFVSTGPASADGRAGAWIRPVPTDRPALRVDPPVESSSASSGESTAPLHRRVEFVRGGGDDVVFGDPRDVLGMEVDVASNGEIYVGLTRRAAEAADDYVEIFRSTDDGNSWTSIGLFVDGRENLLSDIDVVEGNVNRVFVTYSHLPVGDTDYAVRVAHAPLGAASPSWSTRTVMQDPSISFLFSDLAEDSAFFGDYYLYLVSQGDDGNGDDIWYSRSTDQGDTWSAPYRAAARSADNGEDFRAPKIEFGAGGDLHVAFTFSGLASASGDGLLYMKTRSFGGSPDGWDLPLEIERMPAEFFPRVRGVAVDPSGSIVSVVFSDILGESRIRVSDTAGETWPGPIGTALPVDFVTDLQWDTANDRLLIGGDVFDPDAGETRAGYAAAPATDPQDFGTVTLLGDAEPVFGRATTRLATHPLRTPSVMMLYVDTLSFGEYGVAFDGEWRDGPGFPNYETNFPLPLPGTGTGDRRTSPAVVDLDGDGDLEIVFASTDGQVSVFEHTGEPVPGWPVTIGADVPVGAPVAIGDLGPGEPTIVVGDAIGRVHAFRPDGTPRSGFPVDLGTNDDVYAVIGPVGPPYPNWIVAVSSFREVRVSYRGEVQAQPLSTLGVREFGPAVGDVDGDGSAEIVTMYTGFGAGNLVLQVIAGDPRDGILQSRAFAASASAAPSLADLDEDGDLEIMVPLSNGQLQVVHHDMSDVAGFPFTSSSGTPLTRVAAAQILGTFPPELVFAARGGQVHVVYANGVEQFSYPASVESGSSLFGAPVLTQVGSSNRRDVVVGTTGALLHSFANVDAGLPEAWPKDVGDAIRTSAAAGDIDLDGRNELVFVGESQLHVIDVGTPYVGGGSGEWPMEGANPQRTSCLFCPTEVVTSVEGGSAPVVGLDFRLTTGNPVRGFAEFGFLLDRPAVADLVIYDSRGRMVRRLDRSHRDAGEVQLVFDGRDSNGNVLARGTYFARLDVDRGREVQTRKFVWLD